jgi:hypothetical protein
MVDAILTGVWEINPALKVLSAMFLVFWTVKRMEIRIW